jgi:Sigma-70, region 4.
MWLPLVSLAGPGDGVLPGVRIKAQGLSFAGEPKAPRASGPQTAYPDFWASRNIQCHGRRAMSAALQLATVWAVSPDVGLPANLQPAQRRAIPVAEDESLPSISLAFYRRHTESMLRRYLYASMQVGRAPSILSEPIARGWASSRPIRTFEDAVIFVLDVERCLERLSPLDCQILSRVVLQEYTQVEAAALIGMSPRTMSYKYPQAIDRLTEKLLTAGLLILPR